MATIPNNPNNPKHKNKKNKNKNYIYNNMIDDYEIFMDSKNNLSKNNLSKNNLSKNNLSRNNSFNDLKNELKIKEIKDTIRKSSSSNFIGDIIINHNDDMFLIGDDNINIEDYESIKNISKNPINHTNKFNVKNNNQKNNNQQNNNQQNNNNILEYGLINTPLKIIGEELLNDEIKKYKSKAKTHSENNQIIKRLRDIFKKLVYKDFTNKPNISEILLSDELNEDVKLKLLQKYIKFTAEDEALSNDADKIKIEIKNLIKTKKIRTQDDYEELNKTIEEKIMPEHLKIKLEDMYYRIIDGEQPKLHNLVNNIIKLPFEKKHNILEEMSKTANYEEQVKFIKSIYSKLDADLYGLEETKDSIISWICQKINNSSTPSSKFLCLCGPAGVGKTSIVHSISEALNIPYSYISLANIDEPSSLLGHNYTYEGSQYGFIANGLIKNGCTNGILLFDEIDKAKEKVQNTLLGIFDPLQNTKFKDAYFGEFSLNLSESMMILCLNDLEKINPILKDRLHIVNITGYSVADKKNIINKYILPKLESQYNISITIDETVINAIIEKTKDFMGIRQIQMYFVKIYELMILDKYTMKFNFNGAFTQKNINLLKLNSGNTSWRNMYV